jgi:hypothetical protein
MYICVTTPKVLSPRIFQSAERCPPPMPVTSVLNCSAK